jgi:hypothetical protein
MRFKKKNPFKQQQRSREIASHLERTEAENAKELSWAGYLKSING